MHSIGIAIHFNRLLIPHILLYIVAVVEFEEYVFPREILIYETYNPGAVVKLWAFTINEKWVCLWEIDGSDDNSINRTFSNDSQIFSPAIKEIKVPTRIIRIEFNHRNLDYFTEIDGVLLEGVKFTPRGDLQHLMNLSQANKGPIQRKLEKVSFTTVPASNQNQDQLLKDFLIKDLESFIAKINCSDNRGLSPTVSNASDKNPYTLKNMPVSAKACTPIEMFEVYSLLRFIYSFEIFVIFPISVRNFIENLFLFGFNIIVSNVTNVQKVLSSCSRSIFIYGN